MTGVLGYPTRTAAAMAMQAEGRSNRQIAETLNVSVSTASALLASGHRAKKRGGTGHAGSSGNGRGKYGMPTAQLETTVMDLFDKGLNRADIAARLGIERQTVEKVIGYMSEGATDLAFGPYSTKRATDALIEAIRRHHPERCQA